MKFNKLNMGQYNIMKVKEVVKCSVCNEETNFTGMEISFALRSAKKNTIIG